MEKVIFGVMLVYGKDSKFESYLVRLSHATIFLCRRHYFNNSVILCISFPVLLAKLGSQFVGKVKTIQDFIGVLIGFYRIAIYKPALFGTEKNFT